MTSQLDVYKCEVCGNIVEVLHTGVGELVCCKEPMKLLKENTVEASREKHVPVIERSPEVSEAHTSGRSAGGIKVSIGSIPHPMEEKHYIEWIALSADGQVLRQFLKPGDKPSAWFEGVTATTVSAREHCNLHGLWKA